MSILLPQGILYLGSTIPCSLQAVTSSVLDDLYYDDLCNRFVTVYTTTTLTKTFDPKKHSYDQETVDSFIIKDVPPKELEKVLEQGISIHSKKIKLLKYGKCKVFTIDE